MVTLVLKIDPQMAFRLFDEFSPENIEINEDGSYIARTTIPESDWIYGYIMSYGEYAEVLEPKHIKDAIIIKYENALKKYR